MNLLWLVPVLPLAGFVLNGAIALIRPKAKPLVTIIGVGSVAAAFVVAVVVVRAFAAAHLEAPVVFTYWDWIPVGTLPLPASLQLDPPSAGVLLVVAGGGSPRRRSPCSCSWGARANRRRSPCTRGSPTPCRAPPPCRR